MSKLFLLIYKILEGSKENALPSFIDQLISNAKEIGDQAMNTGVQIGKKIEEIKIKDKIQDGTQRLVNHSVKLSSDVIIATTEKFNNIKVKTLLITL